MTCSPVFWVILFVATFFPFFSSAQIEQEQRIQEIDRRIIQLEHILGEDLPPGERRVLEREFEELHTERGSLEEFLRHSSRDREKRHPQPPEQETVEKSSAESEKIDKSHWGNPIVLAAIITTIGGILVALINVLKSKRG